MENPHSLRNLCATNLRNLVTRLFPVRRESKEPGYEVGACIPVNLVPRHAIIFIVLKISLFFMSSSHDPEIRMFYCLFSILKISLFSMLSNHDPEYTISLFFLLFKKSLSSRHNLDLLHKKI